MALRREPDDEEVLRILKESTPDDKIPLVDYITDSGEGRISLSDETLKALTKAKKRNKFTTVDNEHLLREVQEFGGNSFINLLRFGSGVTYKEVASDVASKLGASVSSSDSCEEIEKAILKKVIEKAWDEMSAEQRKKLGADLRVPAKGAIGLASVLAAAEMGGFATYRLAVSVANSVARQLLGRGLAFGTNAGLVGGLDLLIGPIGWAITALWMAADLAGPAYRVTVPCVIHISFLRQKAAEAIAAESQLKCSKGHVQADRNAQFCSQCGEKLRPASSR